MHSRAMDLTWLTIFDSDRLTAWATAGGTVVVAVSAILAAVALRRQARDTEAATRPVLVAALRASPILHDMAQLRIENYGQSPAFDVRVTLPSDLLGIGGGSLRHLAELIVDRYARPVPLVPPRGVLANTYFWLDPDAKTGANRLPLPDELRVEITYRSGAGRRSRTYHDVFELSMAEVQAETVASPGMTTKAAVRIARALEAIARGIGSTK